MTFRSPAAAALTIAAALATPDLPWHVAPALLGLAVIGWFDRAWIWPALGAATVWGLSAGGDAGPYVLVGAVILGVAGRRRMGLAVAFAGVVLAAKQHVAAGVLPAAADAIPWVLAVGVGAGGAVSAARGSRWEAGGIAVAAGIVLARLVMVWSVEGEARVAAAARLDAVDLVYDALLVERDAPLEALVRAAPARDEAALALGWARALDLGWRPARADGVVVDVARALEARGRGGEALRLLAKHPREGDVDALRALLERTQGVPVRWRGAPLGPTLPGRIDPGLRFETNGWAAVELTVSEPLPALILEGEGTAYEGAPVLEVRLDARPPVRWALDGPATLTLDGPIEPGPHRVGLRFVNDRADAHGDRNVAVTGVRG